MIELTMFPGQDGDSLLLEYGTNAAKRRVLVDGGRASSYLLYRTNLTKVPAPPINLLVVTHIDQDHVLGIIEMFRDPGRPKIEEVWFNGYDHLTDNLQSFGAREGELLTSALIAEDIPWNRAFDGRAVVVGPKFEALVDQSKIQILSPDREELIRLVPFWEQECAKHGLIPGKAAIPLDIPGFESLGIGMDIDALAATKFASDKSVTNATSIAFLFEYEGVRLVFTGDGKDARLVESLRPLAEREGGRIKIDALKVAHHGSAGNLSQEFLELIDCPRYLISTNGARHGHPDDIAIARILKYGGKQKELVFNYRSQAKKWDVEKWKEKYEYSVLAPLDSDGFCTLRW